jgi:precorrin-6B methylase 2
VGNKYGVLIAEITQRLPTYIARIRLRGQVITTTITATNLAQARELLAHLYGANNVLRVSMV